MKKLICVAVLIACMASSIIGCENTGKTKQTPDVSGDPTPGNTATATAAPTPSGSAGVTNTPEGSADPSASADPSPSASASTEPGVTPAPTPTPTPRPAQTVSIVPEELLTVGYTEPLPPETVNFPANYNMPYYIEADITNQCVNIFIKNEETGKYDVLLNRFVCSGGTSDQPTLLGHFFIKTDAQEGRKVKNAYYYFQKYDSHAYYITRYSGAYMFHSFTYTGKSGAPKSGAYYNMGNPGSAGCLRMLMGHAKWIYENIDPGTYVVVNKNRPTNKELREVLQKYVPPLGWDMTPDWKPGDNSYGLVPADNVPATSVVKTPLPPTPTPTPTPTPAITPTPTATVTAPATVTPTPSSDNEE